MNACRDSRSKNIRYQIIGTDLEPTSRSKTLRTSGHGMAEPDHTRSTKGFHESGQQQDGLGIGGRKT